MDATEFKGHSKIIGLGGFDLIGPLKLWQYGRTCYLSFSFYFFKENPSFGSPQ